MSDRGATQQAIRAMEWMLCDYEHLNTIGEPLSANWPLRVQAVKDAVAALQAAQAQAQAEPVGQALACGDPDRTIATFNADRVPVGAKLYTTPPAAAVNQQLLDALMDARSALRYIRGTHGEIYGVGFDRVETNSTAAILAAQEQSK